MLYVPYEYGVVAFDTSASIANSVQQPTWEARIGGPVASRLEASAFSRDHLYFVDTQSQLWVARLPGTCPEASGVE